MSGGDSEADIVNMQERVGSNESRSVSNMLNLDLTSFQYNLSSPPTLSLRILWFSFDDETMSSSQQLMPSFCKLEG